MLQCTRAAAVTESSRYVFYVDSVFFVKPTHKGKWQILLRQEQKKRMISDLWDILLNMPVSGSCF